MTGNLSKFRQEPFIESVYLLLYNMASGFVSDVKDMTSCFLNQGFIFKKVQELYTSFCSKYLYRWVKFGVDVASNEVISKIFPSLSL